MITERPASACLSSRSNFNRYGVAIKPTRCAPSTSSPSRQRSSARLRRTLRDETASQHAGSRWLVRTDDRSGDRSPGWEQHRREVPAVRQRRAVGLRRSCRSPREPCRHRETGTGSTTGTCRRAMTGSAPGSRSARATTSPADRSRAPSQAGAGGYAAECPLRVDSRLPGPGRDAAAVAVATAPLRAELARLRGLLDPVDERRGRFGSGWDGVYQTVLSTGEDDDGEVLPCRFIRLRIATLRSVGIDLSPPPKSQSPGVCICSM